MNRPTLHDGPAIEVPNIVRIEPGHRIGHLVAERMLGWARRADSGRTQHTGQWWEWRCDCGSVHESSVAYLRSKAAGGLTPRCGACSYLAMHGPDSARVRHTQGLAWAMVLATHGSVYVDAAHTDLADANASLAEGGTDIGADLRPGFTLSGCVVDYVDAGAAVDDDARWIADLGRQMDREAA